MPRSEPTPYAPTDAEMQALGARLFGLEEHEPTPRRVAGPDERVPIELTYTQVGMLFGALTVLQMRLSGPRNELVQREVEALRTEMMEQVQEKSHA